MLLKQDMQFEDSVSCLHAIEYFGLSQYVDAIDPEGCKSAKESSKNGFRRGNALHQHIHLETERNSSQSTPAIRTDQNTEVYPDMPVDLICSDYVDSTGMEEICGVLTTVVQLSPVYGLDIFF